MDGMNGTAMSPSSSSSDMHMMKKKMMMHMSFYWDDKGEILFRHWPGTNRPKMYYIALAVVFILAFALELVSRRRVMDDLRGGSLGRLCAGLLRTLVHAVRVGLAYLVMLAVMSFNGGVFVAAVAGHVLGFFLFGSNVFGDKSSSEKTSDDFSCNC